MIAPGSDRTKSERKAAAQRWRSRLRLWSGCVLVLYVTLHLANHALGLISLDAMEAGRVWFVGLWRNPLGTAALYTSLLVHPLLALWSLYRRRTLRMPAWEATQVLLGLAIPPLLAAHIVGTRLAYEWYGQVDAYSRVVLVLWELRPEAGARQATVLIIAWLHGCVGLNRYFEAVGSAIERAGGITNQFTGDGVMALFGVDADPPDGCRRALLGAQAMVEAVDRLSRTMADEMDEPLRIGIGIHTGPAVVGRMGYGSTVYLTAVGDTVHVASRFQDLTKQYQAQLVISEQVAERAGIDASTFPRHEITVRNRHEPLAIRVIADVTALDVARIAPR